MVDPSSNFLSSKRIGPEEMKFPENESKDWCLVIVKEITFYGHFFVANQYLHKSYLVGQVSTLKFTTVYQY